MPEEPQNPPAPPAQPEEPKPTNVILKVGGRGKIETPREP